MGKITEIKFVGQSVFKQIMNLVERVDINGLINKHGSIIVPEINVFFLRLYTSCYREWVKIMTSK
jgi:hypothetical protein